MLTGVITRYISSSLGLGRRLKLNEEERVETAPGRKLGVMNSNSNACTKLRDLLWDLGEKHPVPSPITGDVAYTFL